MIIDECLLVFVQSQAEPPPPRVTARSARSAAARAPLPPQQYDASAKPPANPLHSVDELQLIGCVDEMSVMQATKRVRAPTNMAARPRLGRKPNVAVVAKAPQREEVKKVREKGPAKPPRTKPATTSRRRKPLGLPLAEGEEAPPAPPPPIPARVASHRNLIENLNTPDESMKKRALEIVESYAIIKSEPALPIHTAIRIVLQASLDLGRPYDTNMLAMTFSVTRSLVMQALRKYYEGFMEQSEFTESLFVPTYLWIYGVPDIDKEAINKAIILSGTAEPGCRSVFAIARDFVILYVSEVIHGIGKETTTELAGLSSISAVMSGITVGTEVPPAFLEMTNSFLYRARMTGRQVIKMRPELVRSRGGAISGLFV